MKETLSLLTSSTHTAVILVQQKGACAWLGTLPIEEHGLALHKGAFRDALALRYGWQPNGLPTTCTCGKANNVQHALSCMKRGLPIHRHNDIRDLTTSLMEEVSTSTETEPALQPLSGEMMPGLSANIQDDSRVDIRCRGFWGTHNKMHFFMLEFSTLWHHPIRPPHSLQSSRGMNREEKSIRPANQGSRTWLIQTSCLLGLWWNGPLHHHCVQAAGRSGSREERAWLRCRLSFSLLRSAIIAIRGSRTERFNRERTQQI